MKPITINVDDYANILNEYHKESDRGAAVLAGGMIESILAEYLAAHMVDDAGIHTLFEGFGPFASYAQRYETAYAFGLIHGEARSDLKIIGRIRNRFAHNPLETSFDAAPVRDWCQQLSIKKKIAEHAPHVNNSNRELYIIAIGDISAGMRHAILTRQGKEVPDHAMYVRIE